MEKILDIEVFIRSSFERLEFTSKILKGKEKEGRGKSYRRSLFFQFARFVFSEVIPFLNSGNVFSAER